MQFYDIIDLLNESESKKMKVDYHKLQDLIKDKLRENVDVFEDFDTDRSFEGSEWLKKFAEDDKKQSIKTQLYNCIGLSEDLYNHVMRKRAKADLFVTFRSYKPYAGCTFSLRIEKISETLYDCVVEEQFDMSKKMGLAFIFDGDRRISFSDLEDRPRIDWAIRILQCDSSSFLEAVSKVTDLRRFKTFQFLLDEDGGLLDEYRDVDIYDLGIDRFSHNDIMFLTDYLIEEHWPFKQMARGWHKEYKFQLDISDAIIDLSEDQVQLKSKVKSRILSELNKACPAKIKFEDFGDERLDTFSETIALRIKEYIWDYQYNLENFTDSTVIPMLDYLLGDHYVYTSSVDYQHVSLTLDCLDNKSSVQYSIECTVYLKLSYDGDVDMICEDGYHRPLDDFIEEIARDQGLESDYYDQIREEILDSYVVKKGLWDDINFKVVIDFTDLFE